MASPKELDGNFDTLVKKELNAYVFTGPICPKHSNSDSGVNLENGL
jgi:hypothetical protein